METCLMFLPIRVTLKDPAWNGLKIYNLTFVLFHLYKVYLIRILSIVTCRAHWTNKCWPLSKLTLLLAVVYKFYVRLDLTEGEMLKLGLKNEFCQCSTVVVWKLKLPHAITYQIVLIFHNTECKSCQKQLKVHRGKNISKGISSKIFFNFTSKFGVSSEQCPLVFGKVCTQRDFELTVNF